MFARHRGEIAIAIAGLLAATAAYGAVEAPLDPPPARFDAPPADAQRTLSGLAWQELATGSGDQPEATSKVLVYFRGWSRDGAEVMSNFAQPEPAPMELPRVFPIWREAVLTLRVGGRGRFWTDERSVPPAPGGGGRPVIFDIHLVGIEAPPAAPAELAAPPDEAETTPLGARTVRLSPGSGTVRPAPNESALLSYTGWTAGGKVFDASAQRGRPTLFPLDRVMPAFSECVQRMVVGERRRCWIPAAVARGMWVGGPQGDLVFDLQLIDIRPALPITRQPPPSGGR